MLTGARKKCLLSHVLSSSLLTPLQIDSGESILDNYVKNICKKRNIWGPFHLRGTETLGISFSPIPWKIKKLGIPFQTIL
jgi:hypothetical protein